MSKALALVSAACVLGIMVLVMLDVSSRLLTGASFPGAIEYSESLLVVSVAFGFAEGQRRKAHVAMEVVTSNVRSRVASTMKCVAYIVSACLVCWMTYESVFLAIESYQSGEARYGSTQIPRWPARAAMALGLAVLAFEIVRDVIHAGSEAWRAGYGMRPWVRVRRSAKHTGHHMTALREEV